MYDDINDKNEPLWAFDKHAMEEVERQYLDVKTEFKRREIEKKNKTEIKKMVLGWKCGIDITKASNIIFD